MALKKYLLIVTVVSMFSFVFAALTPAPALARGPVNPQPCTNSVVDVALAVNAQTGEFSTLIAALSAVKLVKPLDCIPGKSKMFTVFAPTDAAFAKLGLNKDNIGTAFDKRTLRNILLYHLVFGKPLDAQTVLSRTQIRMANRGTVGVELNDNGAFLLSGNEPAKIIATDIRADNGIIHVIDSVLLP